MRITPTASSSKLPAIIKGPTVTLLNTGEEYHPEKIQEEEIVPAYYSYMQYRLDPGEYELVLAGIAPGGTTWDDALRAVQRGALYDEADRMINKYSTDVPDETRREQWIAYKAAVRATQQQQEYPVNVEYPDRPE